MTTRSAYAGHTAHFYHVKTYSSLWRDPYTAPLPAKGSVPLYTLFILPPLPPRG